MTAALQAMDVDQFWDLQINAVHVANDCSPLDH